MSILSATRQLINIYSRFEIFVHGFSSEYFIPPNPGHWLTALCMIWTLSNPSAVILLSQRMCILPNQNFLCPHDIVYTSVQLCQWCKPFTLLPRSSFSELGLILLMFFFKCSVITVLVLVTALKHIMSSLPYFLSLRIRNQGPMWKRWMMLRCSTPTESWKTTKTCESSSWGHQRFITHT